MRIISGQFKGKKILQPKDKNTRPLKDLTKESIFNIINHSNKFNINTTSLITYVKDRPGHDIRYAIDSDKIKKKLKWYPKTEILEGLEKTFSWYLNNQLYFKSISKKNIKKRLGKNDK